MGSEAIDIPTQANSALRATQYLLKFVGLGALGSDLAYSLAHGIVNGAIDDLLSGASYGHGPLDFPGFEATVWRFHGPLRLSPHASSELRRFVPGVSLRWKNPFALDGLSFRSPLSIPSLPWSRHTPIFPSGAFDCRSFPLSDRNVRGTSSRDNTRRTQNRFTRRETVWLLSRPGFPDFDVKLLPFSQIHAVGRLSVGVPFRIEVLVVSEVGPDRRCVLSEGTLGTIGWLPQDLKAPGHLEQASPRARSWT